MGTHSYVGVEHPDGTVEYVEYYLDGYFSEMVPFLKKYQTREAVLKLIEERNATEHNKAVARSTYALLDQRGIEYVYVFANDEKWICHKNHPYFYMDELKY